MNCKNLLFGGRGDYDSVCETVDEKGGEKGK